MGSLLCVWWMFPCGGASETASTSPLRCASSISLCPPPTVADIVGDGGGCASSSSAKLPLRGVSDERFLECLLSDLPLVADFIDCASTLSTLVVDASPASCVLEARGLSVDSLLGILVRRALLKDRVDSLVSDLLKDGYESRLGPVGVCEPLLLPSFSFDGWLPMLAM